jgi:hypothetical protein
MSGWLSVFGVDAEADPGFVVADANVGILTGGKLVFPITVSLRNYEAQGVRQFFCINYCVGQECIP